MAIQRQSNLDFDKWNDLRAAIGQLIVNGTYEHLVRVHAGMLGEPDGFRYSRHRMHGMGSMLIGSGPLGYRRFLPWHRAYLIIFERELRRIDDSLSIPYWDWNEDAGKLKGFRDLIGLSSGRNLGTMPSDAPVEGRVPWFTNEDQVATLHSFGGDYYTFTRVLEDGPHNGGHAWIGR